MTHPILGHAHDHQGKCEILDGSINNNFVFYDTENSNVEFIITLGGQLLTVFIKILVMVKLIHSF